MIKKLKAKVVVLAALVLLAGCATIGALSPKQQYLAARIEFNTIQKQYLDYYDKAIPELQAKWKANIDPIFDKAEMALDAWGVAVKDGITGEIHQQQYLDLKNQLIDVLAGIFAEEVK